MKWILIPLVFLFLFAGPVLAQSTSSTNYNLNLDLTSSGGASLASSNYRQYGIIGDVVGSAAGHATDWCYQETANVSTVCGGLATGTYFDGGDTHYIYMNYTVPSQALPTSLWQVKYGKNTDSGAPYFYNVTIPYSCWNTTLSFRFFSLGHYLIQAPLSYGQCWNTTNWINITEISTASYAGGSVGSIANSHLYPYDGNWETYAFGYPYISFFDEYWYSSSNNNMSYAHIYEEAMWWNFGAPGYKTNLGFLSGSPQTSVNVSVSGVASRVELRVGVPPSYCVAPTNQTTLIGIYNVTAIDGGANIYASINETFPCFNVTLSNTSACVAGLNLTTSNQTYLTGLNGQAYLWAFSNSLSCLSIPPKFRITIGG